MTCTLWVSSKGEGGTGHNKHVALHQKMPRAAAEFLLTSSGKARGSSEGSQARGGLRKHNQQSPDELSSQEEQPSTNKPFRAGAVPAEPCRSMKPQLHGNAEPSLPELPRLPCTGVNPSKGCRDSVECPQLTAKSLNSVLWEQATLVYINKTHLAPGQVRGALPTAGRRGGKGFIPHGRHEQDPSQMESLSTKGFPLPTEGADFFPKPSPQSINHSNECHGRSPTSSYPQITEWEGI